VPPADVVGETLAALAARADWPAVARARHTYLTELREACAGWDPDARRLVAAEGLQVEVV
jgi:hypothetical protein